MDAREPSSLNGTAGRSARSLIGSALVALLASAAIAQAGVRFVDGKAVGAKTGASWADAFTDLQDALHIAQAGDEVWVAAGTYTPDSGTLSVTKRFDIPSGVGLYGGFSGDETVRSQSDSSAHVTTLSGDLLGDGSLKSHQVLRALSTMPGTVLDGFVVSGGHSAAFADDAAGLTVKTGFLTVIHCRFEGNVGSPGAIACKGTGTTTIDQCLFLANVGNDHSGAVYVTNGHLLHLRNSTFLGNAGATSGALAVFTADATVTGCLFSGNTNQTFGSGGAIYGAVGTIQVANSSFAGNVSEPAATGSAGALSFFSEQATVANCVLWGDSSPLSTLGQSEISSDTTTLTLDHCILQGWSGQFSGPDNSGLDPLFVDATGTDGVSGTEDDDLRLQPGSPAIDSGDNSAVLQDSLDSDLDGNTTEPDPLDHRSVGRFEDDPDMTDIGGQSSPVVDRGCFEFSRWTNLGHALGGQVGPVLIGSGPWKPANALGFIVTGATPAAVGLLFVGTAVLNAPFKGGVLVPMPLFSYPIMTSVTGSLSLQSTLPANVPSHLSVTMQIWFADPAAPKSVGATNAVNGDTP